MIFTKESLKRSIKPIIFVILVCLLVWIWGNHHKVDVELTVHTDIAGFENPTRMDVTVYEENSEDVASTFSSAMTSNRLPVQKLSLAPGTYHLRGIVTMDSGKTHIVTQTIIVPNERANIEIWLREKN